MKDLTTYPTTDSAKPAEIKYELDAETRSKMARQKQGAKNPNFGRPRDPETCRKISQSQTKRHAKIKAFNEASKMSSIKRVWDKTRWQGFVQYNLVQCNESLALYTAYDLNNQSNIITYRVYYYFNDILSFCDFESEESAFEFYQTHTNPDVQILTNEAKTKVIVLGILEPQN